MRILVVRIGRAGDMVMTTPALKALLQCYPDAHYTLLTSLDGKRLLSSYDPGIKQVWVWNRSSITAAFAKRQIINKLRSEQFDKIFCFETSRSITCMFDGLTGEFYGHKAGSNEGTHTIHSAQAYLNIVSQACSNYESPIWANLPVNAEASRRLEQELLNHGISASDTVVALHPTYSGFSKFNLRKRDARKHKLWPATRYAGLAQQLSKLVLNNHSSPKVIMDLLDNEMTVGNAIKQLAGDSLLVLNEKPDFERYKALLHRANLLVSPDTGPMHIAAALNTRVVALFSGKDPADCGPFMDDKRFHILRAEHHDKFTDGIAAIDTASVYNACFEQLNLELAQACT